MQRMKKYLKRLLYFVIAACFLFTAGLVYFLVSSEAPVVTGSVIRNVEYKTGLNLDIYQPTRKVYENAPVVVYIHGGAWIGGLKESLNFNRFNQAVNTLRDSGYAIVTINYTLGQKGKSPFPDCIEDADDAVKWITAHAATYGFDTNNIGLLGESAGAHIAMMLAYADDTNTFSYMVDVYGPNQLAGVLHSPIIDSLQFLLAKLPEKYQSDLNAERYIFALDPKVDSIEILHMVKTYSPYNYLTSAAPPTLIIHGDADRVVPVSQSISLQRKLDSLGVENDLHLVRGADHSFIRATPEQKDEFQKRMLDFILKHYQDGL